MTPPLDGSPRLERVWHAALDLAYSPGQPRTRLHHSHSGPLLVQRPFYPEPDGICHTYVLHPPSGVVGGDQLKLSATVMPGARALITTPAATRFYRSRSETAAMRQHLCVADGGQLEWLPQETLVFAGARAQLATEIDLRAQASFLGWDIVCFGRPTCEEVFDHGTVDLAFNVRSDGRPLLQDRLRFDNAPGHGVAAGLRGHAVCGTFIATGADRSTLDLARDCVGGGLHAASTLLGNLLVCRILAAEAAPIRALFETLWAALRPLLLGRAACPPRIWAT